jgi:hypothetical protein
MEMSGWQNMPGSLELAIHPASLRARSQAQLHVLDGVLFMLHFHQPGGKLDGMESLGPAVIVNGVPSLVICIRNVCLSTTGPCPSSICSSR